MGGGGVCVRRVRACACARSWSRAGRWRTARTSMTTGVAAECVVFVRACACVYFLSYHALTVSGYYPPRLGMLFYILSRLGSNRRGLACYILSRLGSNRRGLACYSISYHALAVTAEAWHAILYLITSWQYLPWLSMLSYILSRLGSICRGLACYPISYHALAVSAEGATSKIRSTKAQVERTIPECEILAPKTRATKAQVEQRETCRRAEVRGTLWMC